MINIFGFSSIETFDSMTVIKSVPAENSTSTRKPTFSSYPDDWGGSDGTDRKHCSYRNIGITVSTRGNGLR